MTPIRYAATILPTLPALLSAAPALSEELDWEVSLSGALALAEVRFGHPPGWTCRVGSQSATAANGSCTGKAISGWAVDKGHTPPPNLGFIVKPSFPVHAPDSPTGIPGAAIAVRCTIHATMTGPAEPQLEDGYPHYGLPRVSGNPEQRRRFCSQVKLHHLGGNAWTLSYDGPTTSRGVLGY